MKNKSTKKISPIEAITFLDEIRKFQNEKDEPTKLISIRIPENILRTLKLKAKFENKKYQSLLVELLRKGLRE